MRNVLVLQNKILHYRKALYNKLSQHHNITVLHSGSKTVTPNDSYKEIIVGLKSVGPFSLQRGVEKEIKSGKYDAVIAMFDLRWLANIKAMYIAERMGINFVWWGVYFTKSKLANWIRKKISRRNNSIVFYSKDALESFVEAGISHSKLYVANNTFYIDNRIKSFNNEKKDIILFVGSLDPRKENDKLIEAFTNIQSKISNKIKLVIIGDGEEKNRLDELVSLYKLNNRIEMKGKITDTDTLLDYYNRAIVSVSFGQAGLSVLQSLGYGVPFITKSNAISGGEKSNILDGLNGFLIEDDISHLQDKLIYLCNNIQDSRKMGMQAYQYYSTYCTIENMVDGFNDALNYKSIK